MLIFISIKGMYFMSDMEINKMNKQREVSILMQNIISILFKYKYWYKREKETPVTKLIR